MVKLYKDLGKTAKKLLNDDYIYDKKVQVKTQTKNGMTYTSTAVQSAKDDSLNGDLQLKFKPGTGVVVTSKLFTAGKMTHEAVLDRLGVAGLKLTMLAGASAKNNLAISTVEYIGKSVTLTKAVDALSGPTAQVTATVGLGSLTAGAEAVYDTSEKKTKACNFALNYTDGGESEATLSVLNKGETGKLAYWHAIRGDFSVATEFMYDKREGAKVPTTLTMGAKYHVDRETTLKAKINTHGQVSASYIQEIRDKTTLILCQKFDVSNPDQNTHKFGLSLVIE